MAEASPREPSSETRVRVEPAAKPKRSLARRILRGFGFLLLLLVVAAAVGLLWVRSQVRASLAQLDGERAVRGLAAAVEVERDALGVPTIHGQSRADVARTLGFLHAQDRFFQMDLMRRQAAGELAEIFGPAVIRMDRRNRLHRFRATARQVIERASPEERAIVTAYAEGVNAGLASLEAKPFEYLAARIEPAPWLPEDSILVVFAMFCELQDQTGGRESALGLMHDTLPQPLADFLSPIGTEWDAPLVGEPFATPPIPGPEVVDLRKTPPPALPKAAALERLSEEAEAVPGSNNWAVAGSRTADGGALLANDMHLGIRVPNTWYRASFQQPDGQGGTRRITGVTLPGTPLMVAGSTGRVAWGFTNSYGDWTDLVVLEVDPKDRKLYRTPEGMKKFDVYPERIRVKGGKEEAFDAYWTIWGPVVDEDHLGRPRVLAWTAHRPESVNLGVLGLETAQNVDEAIAIANRSGIPAQNFTVADSSGRIGWTLIGQIPRRTGFDGRLPTSWADGSRRWDGWLAPEEAPRVVDPPSGQIWTANSRTVDGEMLARVGDGGYAFGARSRQIRDDLQALQKATPADMLKVQLDDRAIYLEPWRDLLLRTLTPEAVKANPKRGELRKLAEAGWTGHASIDSTGYRVVRGFKQFLADRVYTSLTGPCRQADENFGSYGWQFDGPLWKLVTERPAHLLDPQFKTWDEEILAGIDDLLAFYDRQGLSFQYLTWGQYNTTQIRHPLSQAVPMLSRWLDMPHRRLPGDENMPRVQGPGFGASERMGVSPGKEEKGYFHMPVGQSGHPMSPYYSAGHEAWEKGEATPFLPGPAAHKLKLVPAS